MQLPTILAGPIVRRVEEEKAYIWLATSELVQAKATVYISENSNNNISRESLSRIGESCSIGDGSATVCIGKSLHVTLVRVNPLEEKFPIDKILYYDLIVKDENENVYDFHELAYDGSPLPSFYVPSKLQVILHGS